MDGPLEAAGSGHPVIGKVATDVSELSLVGTIGEHNPKNNHCNFAYSALACL
jgi:hypothetical protein